MKFRLPLSLAAALAVAWPAIAAADPIRGGRPQAVNDVAVATPAGIAAATWVGGLEAPWSLVFLPDGRALVSERPGRIRLIDGGRLAAGPVATIAVRQGGEGGLMGLALHPEYPRQPYLYAMHTHAEGADIGNRVIRLRLSADAGTATFDRVVLAGVPGARFHNGGRIAFGPDGMLYVATGETFDAPRAQVLVDLGGKILRVTPDGAVPADNPFPGSPVWSLGHRNVQGLAFHPGTGTLFASEHGPSGEFGLRALDEVNVIRRGANYGWPLAVGAAGDARFADPILAWPDPATPPSGMAFWRGDLFVATLRSQALLRIRLEPASGGGWRPTAVERWFGERSTQPLGRLRDAVAGPDGALYVLTNNRDGRGRPQEGDDRILRITPAQ
ncbi:glucose/arabinose dehydrogenase [Stella humosa]|uniref:Glucose/arabinose dehydrogenase n=1 Tax=Stella humosa TaxID=94 RepID=A0A3N1M2F2_9PROT|nr:PQQ-dependent sugar dehydrogenase [Stella humosa]ROP99901.1 glucose/arabinose dehydrogenase [Stella humosa]BBK30869.1 oxidoreductase [Stella humosa]